MPSEISNGDGGGIVKKIVLIAHDALLQVLQQSAEARRSFV